MNAHSLPLTKRTQHHFGFTHRLATILTFCVGVCFGWCLAQCMRKEKVVHVPCPQQDPCFLASQCFTRKILLRKVNGSGSAWILQRETQGDNFPAFPLPQPWHPTTAYSSALDRSVPHQRELLWACIHSRRITSIHLQNPFDTFFSFNYHDNLVRKIPICQHFVKETWHFCQSRHTYNKTQTVPL